MKNSIVMNGGTLQHLSLINALKVTKDSGYDGYGVWSNQICSSFGHHNQDEYCQIIIESGLSIPEIIWLKPWLYVNGEEKKQSISDIENLCQVAKKINARIITAPTYGVSNDIQLAQNNYKDFCDIAACYELKVGLEFVPIFTIDSLLSAYALVQAVDRNNSGIIIDTFHVFKGSTSLSDIQKVPVEKMLLVHLCDFNDEDPCGDILFEARNKRLSPGRGVFDLQSFISEMTIHGYEGSYSLEVLNQNNRNINSESFSISILKDAKNILGVKRR
ncbi:MAG: sugar phosphate isomerase/epimerase family protein [Gammaproteobacteria bacterium]